MASIRMPDQIHPPHRGTRRQHRRRGAPWSRRSRQDERLETDEQEVYALIVVDLSHVVVGSDVRGSCRKVTEKGFEIGGLGAVVRVDTDDADSIAPTTAMSTPCYARGSGQLSGRVGWFRTGAGEDWCN